MVRDILTKSLSTTIDKNDILIRFYKQTDYDAISKILKQVHKIYDKDNQEIKWDRNSGIRQFRPNLKQATLIAELKESSTILGMGMIQASNNKLGTKIGYLDNIVVREDCIGRQIGKLIMEEGVNILESWKVDSIRINVRYSATEKLLEVFGRAGFNPILVVLEKDNKNSNIKK